jgi:hypothetical protein
MRPGERTLIVRAGALGDFILTLPLLCALRAQAAHLTVATRGRYRALLPVPVDAFVDIDGAGALWLFGAGPPPLPLPALAVVALPGAEDALRARGVAVATVAPRPPAGVHAVDHLLGGASVAPVAGRAPWLPRIGANPLAAGHVVLAPGAGSAEKRWGGWAALAAALHARGIPTLVVPGQDDPPVSLPGPAVPAPGLDGLRALAEGCRAWVGNDTGTTHLAAAAGAQVFAAFGPTDPARWAPRPSRIFGFGADPAALAEEIGRVRVPTGS